MSYYICFQIVNKFCTPLDVSTRTHMDISSISETYFHADRLFDTQGKVRIIKICLAFTELLTSLLAKSTEF